MYSNVKMHFIAGQNIDGTVQKKISPVRQLELFGWLQLASEDIFLDDALPAALCYLFILTSLHKVLLLETIGRTLLFCQIIIALENIRNVNNKG